MEDYIRQVSEWTQNETGGDGLRFNALKGASWWHQDPAYFRTASVNFIMPHFWTPLTGFRCALDGDVKPSPVPRSLPTQAMTDLEDAPSEGPVMAYRCGEAPGGLEKRLLPWNRGFVQGPADVSRGFILHAPAFGPWPVTLFFCEGAQWNNAYVFKFHGPDVPPVVLAADNTGNIRCTVETEPIRLDWHFVPGDDFIDLVTTITNHGHQAGTFKPSSCLSLVSHPGLYDPEKAFTFVLTRDSGFVSFRRLPHTGDRVAWIGPTSTGEHGGPWPEGGVMAVTSRDGRRTIASVALTAGEPCDIAGNTWLNCLHTNGRYRVPANGSRTVRQRFYFLQGDLSDLMPRLQQDVADLR